MLHVQNRELVVPGQLIAEGDYRVREGVFRDGKQFFASVVGLFDLRKDEIRVIPLQGRYVPGRGDLVLGVVIDTHQSGWILDLNSPYAGNLFVSGLVGRKVDLFKEDLDKFLSVGDVVAAEIKQIDERMRVQLDASGPGMGKLRGGKLIEISPAKIPRVIGKRGSMLNTLRSVGECELMVGQNGRIMIKAKDPRRVNAVVEALLMIEREAHILGLTDRVKAMLEKSKEAG